MDAFALVKFHSELAPRVLRGTREFQRQIFEEHMYGQGVKSATVHKNNLSQLLCRITFQLKYPISTVFLLRDKSLIR